jgi:ABC-type polysaccharide/polyol phosphate transport system ATPase subunit
VLAVGDLEFRRRCLDRLEEFRAKQGTLVVVTHDLTSVIHLCDRALWLDQGRIRADGPAADVLAAYQASSAG